MQAASTATSAVLAAGPFTAVCEIHNAHAFTKVAFEKSGLENGV
jgi:hypothetical protein